MYVLLKVFYTYRFQDYFTHTVFPLLYTYCFSLYFTPTASHITSHLQKYKTKIIILRKINVNEIEQYNINCNFIRVFQCL